MTQDLGRCCRAHLCCRWVNLQSHGLWRTRLYDCWPGLAITAVVYGINMFGDAVRDLLDPRLRGGER